MMTLGLAVLGKVIGSASARDSTCRAARDAEGSFHLCGKRGNFKEKTTTR